MDQTSDSDLTEEPQYYWMSIKNFSVQELWVASPNVLTFAVFMVLKIIRLNLPLSFLVGHPQANRYCKASDFTVVAKERIKNEVERLNNEKFKAKFGFLGQRLGSQETAGVALISEDLRTNALVISVITVNGTVREEELMVTFQTSLADGRTLLTTGCRKMLRLPSQFEVEICPETTHGDVYRRHCQRIDAQSMNVVRPTTTDELKLLTSTYLSEAFDDAVDRGIYRPATAKQISKFQALPSLKKLESLETPLAADAEDVVQVKVLDGETWVEADSSIHPEDARTLRQIDQLDQKASGWLPKLLLLGLSLFAFIAAGAFAWDWEFLLLLIPILLFHEAGHYIAMRMLNYREVKMFFLPLLGAAVHGRNHHAPGWQRAVVALAGPLPGILLGFLIGLIAIYWQSEILHKSAILMLVINAFNLMPFLPFDGGWVMQTVIFSRNAYLDFAFRAFAVVGLIGLGVLLSSKIMYFIAIALAIGLPHTFGLTKVVHSLRSENVDPTPDSETGYCRSTLRTIVEKIRTTMNVPEPNRAQSAINAYEQITTRPPGLGGSLAILSLYAGGFVAGFLFTIGLVMAKEGFLNWGNDLFFESHPSMVSVLSRDVETTPGPGFDENISGRSVAIQCPDDQSARDSFQTLKETLPGNQLISRIGTNIVLEIGPADELTISELQDEFVTQEFPVAGIRRKIAPSFQLEFSVDSEQDADNLERLFSGYFDTDLREWLIVPWASERSLTERHLKLRQQYSDIASIEIDAEDEKIQQIQERASKAMENGDFKASLNAARKIGELRAQIIAKLIRDQIETKQIDSELGEKYLARQSLQQAIFDAGNEEGRSRDALDEQHDKLDQLNRELASLLGAIADDGQELSVALVRDTAYCSYVEREESKIILYDLYFNNPASGLATFVKWLQTRGVEELELGFVPDSFDTEE